MDLRGSWNDGKRMRRRSKFWYGISRCKTLDCRGQVVNVMGYCADCEQRLAEADAEVQEQIRLAQQ